MTFVTKLIVIANNKLHATDEFFFYQIRIWPPYNVYMNDLATKL